MPEKEPKKREAPLSYRPPAALRDEFHARVERSGLSVSAFITRAVFGGAPARRSRRPSVEQKTLALLLARAAALADRIHEIQLGQDGRGGSALLIEEALGELAEIRAALLKAMGRKP